MVAWTRLFVTSYVHWLSCSKYSHFNCIVAMLVWPSSYRNDTDRWLPGLPASKRKIIFFSPNFVFLFPKCFQFQGFFFNVYHIISSRCVRHNKNRHKLPWTQAATDMHSLATKLLSEKCVVRRFRRCADVMECTYTNLDSMTYNTPRLYGIAYCS